MKNKIQITTKSGISTINLDAVAFFNWFEADKQFYLSAGAGAAAGHWVNDPIAVKQIQQYIMSEE